MLSSFFPADRLESYRTSPYKDRIDRIGQRLVERRYHPEVTEQHLREWLRVTHYLREQGLSLPLALNAPEVAQYVAARVVGLSASRTRFVWAAVRIFLDADEQGHCRRRIGLVPQPAPSWLGSALEEYTAFQRTPIAGWPHGRSASGCGPQWMGQIRPFVDTANPAISGVPRRTASDRGRGQARRFGVSDLAAVFPTCHRPRRRGRGVESDQVAIERGRLDAVIAGLLFMAGMRRSEVSALRWGDVSDSTDGDGILVTVRRSKTNPEGEVNDVRYVKDGVARAIRTLRTATSPEPGDQVVPLSAQMIGLRFTAATVTAGVESRVTAHSGRVGLASELTSRGASTTDVMLAGNWKTSRMVAHYSAAATAERGAVARYL